MSDKELPLPFQLMHFIQNDGLSLFNISPSEFLVISALVSYEGKNGIYPSIEKIRKRTNFRSKNSVYVAIKSLKKKNILYYIQSEKSKSNVYILNLKLSTGSTPRSTNNDKNNTHNPYSQEYTGSTPRSNQVVLPGVPYLVKLTSNNKLVKRERKKTSTLSKKLSDSFCSKDDHKAYAKKHDILLDEQLEKFKNHYRSRGEKREDWNLQFKNWLIGAMEYKKSKPVRKKSSAEVFSEFMNTPSNSPEGKVYEHDFTVED